VNRDLIGRLTYIANIRLPTEKAHGLQIVRMCEAWQALGIRTTLVHPARRQSAALRDVEPMAYYRVRSPFAVHTLRNLDVVRLEPWMPSRLYPAAHFAHAWHWARRAVRIAATRAPADLYFTRDITVARALIGRGLPAVLELHQLPQRWSLRLLRHVAAAPALRLLVTVTRLLREDVEARGIRLPRSLVWPDAVDLAAYDAAIPETRTADRRPVVLYTGHLFPEKGVGTLIDAALELAGVSVVIAGGMPGDVRAWRERVGVRAGGGTVELLGHLEPRRIAGLQKAADVLVLPNSGRHRHSARETSPMKLFEYMAAGRPIVASDLPAIREVLTHDVNAWLVRPDDPEALASGIRTLLDDPARGARLARQARADVERFSWRRRAEEIVAAAGGRVPGPRETVC
jgi:glycosyltransferase involved in cell wall biosynthesis